MARTNGLNVLPGPARRAAVRPVACVGEVELARRGEPVRRIGVEEVERRRVRLHVAVARVDRDERARRVGGIGEDPVQRGVGLLLPLRVERGLDREPALEELALAGRRRSRRSAGRGR